MSVNPGDKVTYEGYPAVVKHVFENGDLLVQWKNAEGELHAKAVKAEKVRV